MILFCLNILEKASSSSRSADSSGGRSSFCVLVGAVILGEWWGNIGWEGSEDREDTGGNGNPAGEKGKAGTEEGTEEAGLTGSLARSGGGSGDFLSSN